VPQIKRKLRIARRIAALTCAFAAASAQAHITLEYQVAPAGASYKGSFRVGHGCGASPTRQVIVQVPAGVKGARPMPKPGWTIALQKDGADTSRITWTAKTRDDVLPSSHYDEFVLVAQMPTKAGPLYWPVSQVCEEGRNDWTDIPRAGQPMSELKSPAAYLEVLPADGPRGGHHH